MGEPARGRHWRVENDSRALRQAHRRRQLRDAYRATALSTVLPAAGLFRVNRRLASCIVIVLLVPIGFLGWSVARRGALGSILDIGVDRDKLLIVLGAIILIALVWIGGIVATARGTRPRPIGRSDKRLFGTFTTVMCLLVATPVAFAVNGIDIQRQTLKEVLTDTTRAPTTAQSKDPWAGIPRVNLLLLGADDDPDRQGVRPDSIMVASVDTATGDAVFIGLPRNLERVPFPTGNPLREIYPDGFNCGQECLLNAVWTLAEDRPDLFPGDPRPGLTATRDVAEEITGLKIDDTVVVNLSGFEQLVDAMGGVTINAIERVPIGGKVVNGRIIGIRGWIEPGVQHMDGYHALWYSRSRATTDDYSRMRRQRCVVGALVDQVDPVRMLARYPQLAQTVSDNVRIDIPAADLDAWAELVLRMKDGRLQSLPMTNQVVNVARPDYEQIRRLVQDAIRGEAPSPTGSSPTERPPSDVPTSTPTGDPTGQPTDEPTVPDDSLADLGATC
ncbi:MAG TPA: LytR family transcriptional regulator [Intrasporangiaceae bacterium]|nr:LytR family transcriptional regulator [Intrasporangiaceae bacterium]